MIRRCRVRSLNPASARHGRYLRPASREQAIENPFHLLTDRTLRTALFKRPFELRIQHVEQFGVVGKGTVDQDRPACRTSAFRRAPNMNNRAPLK